MTTQDAQSVTKALRDKNIPLIQRITLGRELIQGKIDVYLPRKALAVLDWLLSALEFDANARNSSDAWALLAETWDGSETEYRARVLQNHKFVPLLTNAFSPGAPVSEMLNAVDTISRSVPIAIQSDSTAGELVRNYLKSVQNAAFDLAESQTVYDLVRSREIDFKTAPDALGPILSAPISVDVRNVYLQRYLQTVENIDMAVVPAESVGYMFTNIIESGVNVAKRTEALVAQHLGSLTNILNELRGTKLDPTVTNKLLDLVLTSKARHWSANALLLLRLNPNSVPTYADGLLEKLLNESNSREVAVAAAELMQHYSRMRQFGEFYLRMSKKVDAERPEIAEDAGYKAALSQSLDILSPFQLNQLLGALEGPQLDVVLVSLSYNATSPVEIKKQLLAMFPSADWKQKNYILNLQPWSSTELEQMELPSLEHSFDCVMTSLRWKELNPGFDLSNVVTILAGLDLNPDEAVKLIRRYFRLLDGLSEELISSLLQRTKDWDTLVAISTIFEAPQISQILVDLILEDNKPSTLKLALDIPNAAISALQKKALVDLALGTRSFELLVKLLRAPGRRSDLEHQPEIFISFLKGTSTGDVSGILQVSSLLLRDVKYRTAISGRLNLKQWQHRCVAAFAYEAGSDDYEKLIAVLSTVVTSQKVQSGDLMAALITLDRVLESSDAETAPRLSLDGFVGNLLDIDQASPAAEHVFSILCHLSQHWSAITAYYLYTDERFSSRLLAYYSTLTPAQLEEVELAAMGSRSYGVLKLLNRVLPKSESHERRFTHICISVAVELESGRITEQTLLQFLSYTTDAVSEHSWMVGQFSLEALLNIIAATLAPSSSLEVEDPEKLYLSLGLLLSRILLFQRYRLSGRFYLVLKALDGFLRGLATTKSNAKAKAKSIRPAWITEHNTTSAMSGAYHRLMQNLCDPPQTSVREGSGKHGLTSSVARARRHVAKYGGIMLYNYLYLALQYGFDATVRTDVQRAMFEVLRTMSADDVKAATSTFDHPSRAYFRPLYEEFKATARWTND